MKHKCFGLFLCFFSFSIFNSSENFASEESSSQEFFADVTNNNSSEDVYLNLENNLENKYLLNEEGILIEEGLFDDFTKKYFQLLLNDLSEKYKLFVDTVDNLIIQKTKLDDFCLNIENNLENKYLLSEEGLLIEKDLFDDFAKENFELLLNDLSEKYKSFINPRYYSTIQKVKDNFQSLYNDLFEKYKSILNSKDFLNIQKTKENFKLFSNDLSQEHKSTLEDLKKGTLKLESQVLDLQKSILRYQIGLVVAAMSAIGYGVYKYYKQSEKK